jgi:hypothetical protein
MASELVYSRPAQQDSEALFTDSQTLPQTRKRVREFVERFKSLRKGLCELVNHFYELANAFTRL